MNKIRTFAHLALIALLCQSICQAQDPLLTDPAQWVTKGQAHQFGKDSVTLDAMSNTTTLFHKTARAKNFIFEATLTFQKSVEPSRWAAIVFHSGRHDQAKASWNQCTIRHDSSLKNGVELARRTKVSKWKKQWHIFQANTCPTKREQAKKLKLIVQGSTAKVYIDGQLILHEYFLTPTHSGSIGLSASGCVVSFSQLKLKNLPDAIDPDRHSSLPPMQRIAHRGYSQLAPENSGSSIRKAIAAKADLCEFDVLLTKDKRVVLMHDSKVNRTTDGQGKVAEMTLRQLQQLDAGSWKAKQFKGERILTLEQALQLFNGSKTIPVIEIKAPGATDEVVRIINKHEGKASVIAFKESVIKRITATAPHIPCAWVVSRYPKNLSDQTSRSKYLIDQCKSLGIKAIDPNYKMLSPQIIKALHQEGIEVWAWTINDPDIATLLESWGLNALTTDCLLGEERGNTNNKH